MTIIAHYGNFQQFLPMAMDTVKASEATRAGIHAHSWSWKE
jgi:hypothetical protein